MIEKELAFNIAYHHLKKALENTRPSYNAMQDLDHNYYMDEIVKIQDSIIKALDELLQSRNMARRGE